MDYILAGPRTPPIAGREAFLSTLEPDCTVSFDGGSMAPRSDVLVSWNRFQGTVGAPNVPRRFLVLVLASTLR